MVKWLKEIKVSDQCSDNHYHFKDNRVLPVNVTPEQAEAEGWWFKPDYIINELNINSAISSPGHGEVLYLDECGPTYEIKGYAYGGGGRKIIRVEVTLDGGKSWHLVEDGNVTHPPGTPTAAGKYWGWCMWTITVPTADLLKATNVACRAWDAAMNTQPKELTWNVMGMLNNPWFTVVKHFDYAEDGPVLTFEHPTLDAREDDAAAGARHLHLLLRAAAHDQERHRQARGPGPRPVARPLLLDRSSPNHMMDIAAQNPLKISPALFPPSKDASFIAVAAPTASSPAGTPSTRTIRTPPPRAYDNLQTIRLLNPKPRSPPTTPRSPRSRRPARRRSTSPFLRYPAAAR